MTGLEYRFSGLERLQLLDPRDAVAIVRNRLFRIDAVVEITNSVGMSEGARDA